ncbi:MAG: MFS transporter [Verrucomicrobia bacterium]|nr:MFS transporter [Verrucomicrobiota bacterium]
MKQKWKTLWIAAIGSTLEVYDFTLYAVMIQLLAVKFFPQTDPTASLLFSLATFASGFLIRPISAILWGYLGDRFGRRIALSYTMLAMAAPTCLIGLLPTYDQAGIFATIALICCRILQGASMSGEFNGAMIFVLEHHAKEQQGKMSGILNAINTVGVIVATCFGLLAAAPGMPEWAWRVPFLLGAGIGLCGFLVRRTLTESPLYETLSANKEQAKNPLKEALRLKSASFMTFLQASCNGLITYTMISFMGIYMSKYLQFSTGLVLSLSLLLLITSAVAEMAAGCLIDKIGCPRVLRATASFIIASVTPAFYFLGSSNFSLVITSILICGTFFGAFAVATHVFIQNLFPTRSRYSGVAFCYNVGTSLVGGTAPYLITRAITETGNLLMPAWILLAAILIYFTIFQRFVKTKEVLIPC